MMGFEIVTYGVEQNAGITSVEGKFIQICRNRNELLICAAFSLHRFHNQILHQFLQEHELYCKWITSAQLDYDGSDIEMKGGGRFQIDYRRLALKIWDTSFVYGRFDDTGLDAKIKSAGPPWNSFDVYID